MAQLKIPLVLETLCQRQKTNEELVWVNDEPSQEDIDHLLKEGEESSPFDPLGLRLQVLQDLRSKKAELITKRCEYAKVLAIVYPTTTIPWDLFAKIFAAFGKPKAPYAPHPLWRVVWFANSTLRLFPSLNSEIGPAHINGGYAFPCRPETIVIYREEEVARVLIHELLHAACTDSKDDPIEMKEAKTESWAELFLIAIQTAGKPRKTLRLWKAQAQWIVDQETILKNSYGVNNPSNYAWRYTVARREVLEGFGCVLPSSRGKDKSKANVTLRFTHPSLDQ